MPLNSHVIWSYREAFFFSFAILLPFLWRYLYTYNSQIEDCMQWFSAMPLPWFCVTNFSDFINFVIWRYRIEYASLRMQHKWYVMIHFLQHFRDRVANLWQQQPKQLLKWQLAKWNYDIPHKMFLLWFFFSSSSFAMFDIDFGCSFVNWFWLESHPEWQRHG